MMLSSWTVFREYQTCKLADVKDCPGLTLDCGQVVQQLLPVDCIVMTGNTLYNASLLP